MLVLNQYLESSEYIDWLHPEVAAKAAQLASGLTSKEEITQGCFEFVRDEIRHSLDFQLNPVTCKASDVLQQGTGYCYAKSHLLAALLRANSIPAGLCYQRLLIDAEQDTFCLHGLNAVYLDNFGWYKIDPRGDKPSLKSAEFCPPVECLPFAVTQPGEANFAQIYAAPLDVVVRVLKRSNTFLDVMHSLPDAIE